MDDQLITFETAKLAKEKGFTLDGDHKCYIPNGQLFPSSFDISNYDSAVAREFTKTFAAPSQSLLQKWLREVHNIHCLVHLTLLGETPYMCTIKRMKTIRFIPKNMKTKTMSANSNYECCLEIGLQEALKLI